MMQANLTDIVSELVANELRTLVRHHKIWPTVMLDPQGGKRITNRLACLVSNPACHLVSRTPTDNVAENLIQLCDFRQIDPDHLVEF